MSTSALAGQFGDWKWRLSNLYWIKNEQGEKTLFVPRPDQLDLLENMSGWDIILKARQLGFCLDPSTRVLTADLRWVPIGELQPGARIVAVDECPPGGRGTARRMRAATVIAAVEVHRKAYRITFDDGRSVVCTGQHPWLSRKAGSGTGWRSIEADTRKKLLVGTSVRWVTKPWGGPTVEDGWFGGMLDGEGSLAKPSRGGASINVSQRAGPVLQRLVDYCDARGYNYRIEGDAAERPGKHGRVPVPKVVFSRMDEMFRLLGQTRPTRFIGSEWWEGRELPGKRNGDVGWAKIVSIEPLAEQTMIDLQTSTGTYIAEGFVSHNTTLIDIFALDQAFFVEGLAAAIIAHDRDSMEAIFREKVKYPWENLPASLHEWNPARNDAANQLTFERKGVIRVAMSVRSGTTQILHVSEMGKIARRYPERATEIITGSFPTVHEGGLVFVESTAEGTGGAFYDMVQQAKKLDASIAVSGRKRNRMEFQLHFYPWWRDAKYRANPEGVAIPPRLVKYFVELEVEHGIKLDAHQAAWYVLMEAVQKDAMKREYPSTVEEAFEGANEERYFALQMARARKEGRIKVVPYLPSKGVNLFWDLGRDTTCFWAHQYVATEHRMVGYYGNVGRQLDHFVAEIQRREYIVKNIYLPHDGNDQSILPGTTTPRKVFQQLFQYLPPDRVRVVNRVPAKYLSIEAARSRIHECFFHEIECEKGIEGLDNYRKKWSDAIGNWSDEPRHDEHSHPADAFQTFAMGWEPGHETTAPLTYPGLTRIGVVR